MSDQGKRSLRDIAEQTYDDVVENADAEDVGGPVVEPEAPAEPELPLEPGERPRDERGRWVAKHPVEGEAAAATPPSPKPSTQEPQQPHPAPEQPAPGVAAQAPANWSAEDRANFEKLKPGSWERDFLLRRHSEMEGDYQRRVQANTFSNQFVTAVAPVFDDPVIVQSLRAEGKTPIDAVHQWAAFNKRALDQDDNVRIDLLFELADRMQLDPAVVFGRVSTAIPSFTQEELANPATKKFADHIGYLQRQLKANQEFITSFQRGQTEQAIGARRGEIDAFANAKNQDGSPAHPYFDALLPIIMEHYRASPTSTIEQCYQAAVQPLLEPMKAAAQADVEKRQNLARAQVAARSNVRGITGPVAKPPAPAGKQSMRDVIEAAADEVGFSG